MKTTAPVCDIEIIDKEKVDKTRALLPSEQQALTIAEIFKLLGEPTRLKIVLALTENELCVCDLTAVVDSKISAVSHHLRLLKGARIVKYRKEGKMVYYSLDDDHIKTLVNQLKEHVTE